MPSYPHARQQAQQIADSGDLPGALALLAPVVEAGRTDLPSGDPELLETMRQLAGLHAQAGDPTSARRLLEEAYAAGRGGPAEPLMVLLAYDLAVVAEELANRLVARKNFGLVARYGPGVLGEEHPAVVHARGYGADGAAAGLPEPPTAPMKAIAPPVSGTVVHGTPVPVSGLPASSGAGGAGAGAPVSGMPVSGTPVSGTPGFGQPVSGSPVSGSPVSGTPISGTPVSGTPGIGQPVSASPAFGQPVSGSPDFGQQAFPPAGSTSPFGETAGNERSRAPWLIAAAAAAVVAVVALVAVLVRPGGGDDPSTVAADSTAAPAATTEAPGAGAFSTTGPDGSPSPSPSSAPPSSAAPATTGPAKPPATTGAPKSTAVTAISAPANGAGVARLFTVTFTTSAADASAAGTRLALTVCVKEWCFLEGPLTIENGRARNYPVLLGSKEGEGIGEQWTVRVDRLSNADYDYLQAHKQAATAAGTWGNGVSTPIDRLNKAPVSAVVVTKTS
ncbi:tetratricopeptide repeat protein [Catenuloplanes japonicus]|uniref:tetratricopeptide repeat protein n=1 Tax=Catenuloplanes japonicus TaxID=33876 RepID=UPI00068DF64A|nr:tetratricopeptide repeat protein [Catenuloplanes japonicus]